MNTLTIEALTNLCLEAMSMGRGKCPVVLSVDYGMATATTLTAIEDGFSEEYCCLVIRDEMAK